MCFVVSLFILRLVFGKDKDTHSMINFPLLVVGGLDWWFGGVPTPRVRIPRMISHESPPNSDVRTRLQGNHKRTTNVWRPF